jgi:hypothetical protein
VIVEDAEGLLFVGRNRIEEHPQQGNAAYNREISLNVATRSGLLPEARKQPDDRT